MVVDARLEALHTLLVQGLYFSRPSFPFSMRKDPFATAFSAKNGQKGEFGRRFDEAPYEKATDRSWE